MPKISKTQLMGASGEQYPFDVYSYDTMFREGLPGIYFIAHRYKLENNQFTLDPIFIGGTSDLSTLYGFHRKQKCFQEHAANVKCIYIIRDDERRKAVVEDLISHHQPYCND